MTEPDRLFIDLIGIDGDPLPVLELNDPIIQRIRSRFNENTIRIVLDLNEPLIINSSLAKWRIRNRI